MFSPWVVAGFFAFFLILAYFLFLAGKREGATAQTLKQKEADDALAQRMETIRPFSDADVVDKLRNGDF